MDRQPEITALWKEIIHLRGELESKERQLSNTRITRDKFDTMVTELLDIQRLANEDYRRLQEKVSGLQSELSAMDENCEACYPGALGGITTISTPFF